MCYRSPSSVRKVRACSGDACNPRYHSLEGIPQHAIDHGGLDLELSKINREILELRQLMRDRHLERPVIERVDSIASASTEIMYIDLRRKRENGE